MKRIFAAVTIFAVSLTVHAEQLTISKEKVLSDLKKNRAVQGALSEGLTEIGVKCRPFEVTELHNRDDFANFVANTSCNNKDYAMLIKVEGIYYSDVTSIIKTISFDYAD